VESRNELAGSNTAHGETHSAPILEGRGAGKHLGYVEFAAGDALKCVANPTALPLKLLLVREVLEGAPAAAIEERALCGNPIRRSLHNLEEPTSGPPLPGFQRFDPNRVSRDRPVNKEHTTIGQRADACTIGGKCPNFGLYRVCHGHPALRQPERF